MKRSHILLFCLSLLPFFMQAQTRSLNNFYHTYKHAENAHAFTIPGWVMKLGAAIGKKHVDGDVERQALKMVKKVKKLRLLVMEDYNLVTPQALNGLVDGVSSEKFEEALTVRTGDTRVHFFMRDKKDKIKNLLILVSEADTFVLFSAKTKLKYEDISELINMALDGELFDDEEAPEEEPAPKKPQA
ncbi:MAG: DUF4252 domain-containing protein [Phaeodactylibacter sp.]|nr:DUF4252 domain-containing protein [Phaeodactylibacter sp.]